VVDDARVEDDVHGPGLDVTLTVTSRERSFLIDALMTHMDRMKRVPQNDLSEMLELQALLGRLMTPAP
jgi:hypothetical protein